VQSRINIKHLEKYKTIKNNIFIFLKSKLEIYYFNKYGKSGKQIGWIVKIIN